MLAKTFATTSLAPCEQFDAWHTWYASMFDTNSDVSVDEGFPARNSVWQLGAITVSQSAAPAIRTLRTASLIRRQPTDHWVITVYTRGAALVETRGLSLAPGLGVPFVISLADEMATTKGSYERIQLYLPRDRLRGIAAPLDAARGTSLATPEGNLLADYMNLLVRNLANLPAEDAPRLADAVESMLVACIAPSPDRVASAGKQVDFTLMERVRRAVRTHLRSPALGPEKLCHEAATSRSQLYRLLEGEGGVARYIQRRRLSESFTLLSDAANTLPIGRIAEILCFADASSFSRAFRREFGTSPSDVRAASLAGSPPSLQVGDTGHHDIRRFSDCLHVP